MMISARNISSSCFKFQHASCLFLYHFSQVQVFSRVPVIVSTYINRVTCHPEDVSAKLWLNCGVAGLEVAQAPAAATAEVVQSAMAYETLVED